MSDYNGDNWGRGPERVPGARRQKMLGYIKAANELRQTYQSQIQSQLRGNDDEGMPGEFPDVDVVRSGDEEMLLFPSYARKHVKRDRNDVVAGRNMPGSEGIEGAGSSGDADYWRREWEKYEDANAIVDVDVRGWIYSPQRGPMTRKNRFLLAVARRLSGIPAPEQNESAISSSLAYRSHETMMSREEEAAAREADMIAQHGQREVDRAWRGAYSTESNRGGSNTNSRSNSPSPRPSRIEVDEEGRNSALASRPSWSQSTSTEMSREELVKANELLMTRLRPFMTLPLTNTPITVFFFNEEKSISKSVTTDESGHFNLRAALNFVPNKVRVLASENLSTVEDVVITDSQGVSLISDIDDTIKHSAIASGAREIFKNTFIKSLHELTIQGVKEWYSKMAQLGIKMHYVSNSPWQLYPLLKSYFTLAGLPPGSIHLKQYSGMLQGIFEPAAERKKGSLEKIFFDFPERKFILVGDSGEADLEVYTDMVLANPGRVLGVFIRDVTTTEKVDFAEQNTSGSDSRNGTSRRNGSSDESSMRPSLPTRPKPHSPPPKVEEDLIDFGDDSPPLHMSRSTSSHEADLQQLQDRSEGRPQAPNKPAKPSNLRSFSTAAAQANGMDKQAELPTQAAKRVPPPPPKPRRPSSALSAESQQQETPAPLPSSASSNQISAKRPVMDSRTTSSYSLRSEDDGYVASARRHLTSAYNALPALRSQSPTRESDQHGPPPPPRRGLSAYPAAAARWATGATGGDPAAGGDGGAPGAPYNKKEEFWKRRWARSEEIMRRQGVVLRTWRVGSDVMDECVRIAERALQKPRNRG